MVMRIRRIDVLTALRVGLVFGPVWFTVSGLIFAWGQPAMSIGDYLGGAVQSILYGGAGAAIAAYAYNLIARRFGPVRIHVELDEPKNELQNPPRS